MQRIVTVLCLFLTLSCAAPVVAQQAGDRVYIQVQARNTLSGAVQSAEAFAQRFDDVRGFAIGGGWYGITLGPYTRDRATADLLRLRAVGAIPGDSYLVAEGLLGAPVWPDPDSPAGQAAADAAPSAPARTAQPAPEPTETPAEARASERLLNRAEREELQVALQWAGFYRARIDGAFGRGTRNAMAAWQAQNGHPQTGVLTTRQRAELLGQYNAVFDGLGLARVDDPETGIVMEVPLDVVAFEGYAAPFARYAPLDGSGIEVLQISQPGDRSTLGGLYEIMQTLELVPLDGPRQLGRGGFFLEGRDAERISHTEAELRDGQIKGFTLVWPAGDEARRTRVLARLQDSFVRRDGVLDPTTLADDAQAVDLVAGLRVRQPVATASGFYVNDSGAVLTSADGLGACTRLTLDDRFEATLVATDADLGLAVLRPTDPLVPRSVARFNSVTPRLQSEIAVAGYSYGGVLGAPSLTFGRLADLRGLDGEAMLKRLAVDARPGDSGGPVFDTAGSVLGMLLPRAEDGRVLPEDVGFAANADAILAFLRRAGVAAEARSPGGALDPVDLTRLAREMTVLVSCWD